MAYSCCGFCKSTSFEIAENSPSGSRYKVMFVQCSSCGHPIGVLPYTNTEYLINKTKEQLESQVRNVAGSLDSLYANQQRIINELQKLKK